MTPIDPRLLRRARAARTVLALTVALGAVAAIAVSAQAWLLATGVDRIAHARSGAPSVTGVAIAVVAVVGVRAGAGWAQEVASRRAAASVKRTLRHDVVSRLAAGSQGHAGATPRAATATLVLDGLDALDDWFAKYLPQLVLAVIVPIVVLVQLMVVDTTTAVIVALTLPLIPVFMWLVGRMTEAATARRWLALTRLSHHFLDVVEGMPTLRAFGRGDAQVDQVRANTDRYRGTTMATLRIAFLSSLVLELLATLSVALVAVSVGLRLVRGELSLRDGVFLIVIAPEAYLPLRQVGVHYHASAAGAAAAAAAFDVLEAPLPEPGRRLAVPALDRGFELRIDDVGVRHDGRTRLAPDGATLVVRGGELVALAGPSGCGKSTLVEVVLGFRRPDSGSASLVAGATTVAVHDLEPAAWRRHVGWVDQHPFVQAGTVASNLRLGRTDAADDDLTAALARVGLDLPLGRVLGERGLDLSAGERRRLVLARQLLRRADLLVLDEATAGLDRASEQQVLRAARDEADRGAAVLLVAHRPDAIAAADRVVMLP
ncbi:MAG: thiol reductant ABC exporter subunit CydD [Acidimicrobiales bacterium]